MFVVRLKAEQAEEDSDEEKDLIFTNSLDQENNKGNWNRLRNRSGPAGVGSFGVILVCIDEWLVQLLILDFMKFDFPDFLARLPARYY